MHAVEEARKSINLWVEGYTAGKVRDLFPPDSLDGMTRMVLANAIYFKGESSKDFVLLPTFTRNVERTLQQTKYKGGGLLHTN